MAMRTKATPTRRGAAKTTSTPKRRRTRKPNDAGRTTPRGRAHEAKSLPSPTRGIAADASPGRARALDGEPRVEATRGALSVTVMEAVPGTCLSLKSATRVVLRAANNFPGDMDASLERAGLITEPQRAVFRQRVFEGVLEAGCHISAGAIPNGPGVRLSDVRDAIQARAS